VAEPGPTHAADEAVSAPTIETPESVGFAGYGETFNTDEFTGTAQLELPINASKARALTPALKLRYTSGANNGLFGLGWTLDLPAFRCRTDKGIPQYNGQDTVLSPTGQVLTPARQRNADGQWVPLRTTKTVDGRSYEITQFRPRRDSSFDKIERWSDLETGETHWQTVDADNTLRLFGDTPETRLSEPDNPDRTFQWSIRETRDAHGNRTIYTYEAEGAGQAVNLYPKSIAYGNYRDTAGVERFAFLLHFAYAPPSGAPPILDNSILPRSDPFSSFRSGFEVRTRRLCHAVMMVHQLADHQFKPAQVVSVTEFKYSADDGPTRLETVRRTGWRTQADGSAYAKSLPPIQLGYSDWQPETARFASIKSDGAPVPQPLDGQATQFIDLYGEGRPGVLAHQTRSLTYWPPAENGTLAAPGPPGLIPVIQPDARAMLTDVAGNGHLDLMVIAPGQAGYFRNHNDGSWGAFTAFQSAPLDLSEPTTRMVDLNGDGLADLLSSDVASWRVALSDGPVGFQSARSTPAPDGTAVFRSEDPAIFAGFADMFGDGLQHLVRISSGTVSVWPSLGYGRFGARRDLLHAPLFADNITAARILLADTTGDGAADLLLIGEDTVTLHRNLYGAGFAAPVEIAIPSGVDAVDLVSTADVYGRGASALVVSQTLPGATHLALDFTRGARPYFLTTINNNMGARTQITYRSSTDYYLADKAAGLDWASKLAFPVQVVAEIETHDDVAQSTLTRVFQYRDGFFDPVERQFQGFGYVQTQDFPAFDPTLWHFPRARPSASPSDTPVEAQMVRTWRLTGASQRHGLLSAQLEQFAWHGDPDALNLAALELDADLTGASGETMRQAYLALSGQVVRSETFGLDGDGVPQPVPYRVELSQVAVRMIQPVLDERDAVFNVVEQAQVNSIYDQDARDPRIEHHCVLSFDSFGHPLRRATAAYPRRTAPVGQARQLECLLTLQTHGVINHVNGRYENGSGNTRPALDKTMGGDFHIVGTPFEDQAFELSGFPAPNLYFSRDQLIAIANDALADQVDFGMPFTPGTVQARAFDWSQTLYWSPDQSKPLPLQEIASTALLHHIQTGQLSKSLYDAIYDGRITDAEYTTRTGNILQDGYWWSPGLIESYYPADQYYLESGTEDPFGGAFKIDYDDYCLAMTTLTDPLGARRVASQDYQAQSPAHIVDINENTSGFLYDPLGMLIVTTASGSYDGQPTGDAPLNAYTVITDPTCQDILTDPTRFLQGASTFFYYDLGSWAGPEALPPHTIELTRRGYLYGGGGPLESSPTPDFGIRFNYFDGLGRSLAQVNLIDGDAPFDLKSTSTTGGVAAQWRVQDQVRYDDRGTPTRRYQPYLSAVPSIDRLPDLPHWRLRYDALYREIGTTTPKGFLTRQIYAAWQSERWDADDTVTTSPYYRDHITDPKLPAAERRALDLAAAISDTPMYEILDPLGRAIQERQLLVETSGGTPVPQIAASWLDAAGRVIAFADARFCASRGPDNPDFYNLGTQYDMVGNVIALHSADAGNVPLITPADGIPAIKLHDFSGQPVTEWDRRGHERIVYFDLLRNPVRTHVRGDGLDQIVERLDYGQDPTHNTVHRPIRVYDQSGLRRTRGYNIAGNPCATSMQYRTDYATEANWDKPASVPMLKTKYTSELTYTEQSQPLDQRYDNGAVLSQGYLRNGWVRSLHLAARAGETAKAVIPAMQYAANGAPTFIELGSGARTHFEYDADTLRLFRLTTETADKTRVQDLTYTYDPVGNVMAIANPQAVPGAAKSPSGDADFVYDSLYRLTSATGREETEDPGKFGRYTQSYHYDASGNLDRIEHTASQDWIRKQAVAKSSNHAVPTDLAKTGPVDRFFDADGLLLELPAGIALAYDQAQRLSSSGTAFYQYDTTGERSRKTGTKGPGAPHETLYLGDQIIETDTPEIAEVQLRSGNRLLALARMDASAGGAPDITCRYPLNSRTGSVSAELDAAGALLRYEEYFPFGDTALAATYGGPNPARFQFAGKERDEGTDLYYFGQRYYIPGQGRWTTPDPTGTADGPNLFAYVGNNPLTLIDPAGTCGDPPEPAAKSPPPQMTFKSMLKMMNLSGTLLNAGAEGVGSYLGHNLMPANMGDVGRAAGLIHMTSLAGFGAVAASLSGMTYYALDINKYGANRYNVSSLAGNAFLGFEGVQIYRSVLITGHDALGLAHRRIGIIGAVADVLKVPKEIHDGNYGNATFYTMLAMANARSAIPDQVYKTGVERALNPVFDLYQRLSIPRAPQVTPDFKAMVIDSAKAAKPRQLLFGAVVFKAFQTAYQKFTSTDRH
jgi:RHS repeat-associated protein